MKKKVSMERVLINTEKHRYNIFSWVRKIWVEVLSVVLCFSFFTFFYFSDEIVDMLKINNEDYFKYNKQLFILSILLEILFCMFLIRRKIISENKDNKNYFFGFFIDLFIFFQAMTVIILINKFFLKNCTIPLYSLFPFIYFIFILNNIIKHIFKKNYLFLGLVLFILFVTGWISLSHWTGIFLIVVLINQFIDYKDFYKLLIMLNVLTSDDDDEIEDKLRNLYDSLKIKVNISIVPLYFFIALTEKSKTFYSFIRFLYAEYSDVSFLEIPFRGLERVIYILMLYTLFKESKFIRNEYDKYILIIRKRILK